MSEFKVGDRIHTKTELRKGPFGTYTGTVVSVLKDDYTCCWDHTSKNITLSKYWHHKYYDVCHDTRIDKLLEKYS